MKLTHLFIAAAATVLAFAACRQEEPIGVPDLQVTPSSVSFQAGASSQTVTLTATRDWTVSGAPEWLAFDPSSGKASSSSQTVTITAMANSGYNRSADVTFTIGLMKAYVHVDQTGDKGVKDNGKGTEESPFTVEGVKAYIDGLENPSAVSPDKVYIKGKITRINDKGTYGESGNYSNATFYISDDGTTDNEFYCYRIAYLGNKKYSAGQTDIKVGDEVVVYGNVILYGSSNPVYETSQGTAYLYSLNGESGPGTVPAGDPKGTGAKDDPYNVAAAINAVKNLGWTDKDNYDKVGPFYVKGKISRIATDSKTGEDLTFGQSGTYSNATFYISDDGSTDNEFYCYRVSYLGKKKFTAGQEDIKVGDEAVIYGELMNYRSDTPETVQGSAYLYSLNGKTGDGDTPPGPSGEAKGTGTKDDPYNSVAATNAVKNLTWTNNDSYETTGEVYVKGKISRIANNGTYTQGGTYGNASFYISEDGSQTDEFYCFRILYLGNEKYTSGTDIKVGDEVIVCGQLMNYRNDTPETVAGKAYLYSLNGQTSGGGGGETPPGPSGDGNGTLNNPYTPAQAIAAVANLTWTDKDNYDKTDKVYVKGKISKIANNGTYTQGGTYGNASYYISADGTESEEFYIFRSLYFNGEKYTSGTDIKVGDEVIVYGALMNYHNDTPETVANENWLYSLNGQTSGGGGGETPPGPSGDGNGTLNNPYTPAQAIAAVANLTWTDKDNYDKTDKVYVKGKISKIANNGTYTQGGTYGNASYYISADGTENEEFYIFRSLYFNGEKYTSGTDIKVGDEVIVYGALMNYRGDTPETVANENWLYSLNGATSGGSGGSGQGQGQGGGGEATDDFTSNVTWSLDSSAYSQEATVNGTTGVSVLKLGTSSKYGSATLTLPTASSKLSFYAVSWNNATVADLVFKVDGKEVKTVSPVANSGLAGNTLPYTLTVSDSDYFTIDLGTDVTTVTVETSGGYRAALFGIQAK